MGSELQQEERRSPSSSSSLSLSLSWSLSRSKLGMGSEYLSPLVDLPRSPSPALREIETGQPDAGSRLKHKHEPSLERSGIEVTFDSDSEGEEESETETEDNNVAR